MHAETNVKRNVAGRTSAEKSVASTLATTTTIQILSTTTALALTGIAPIVAPEFGLDAHWIGYQISAIYASGMFASASAGTLIARFGPVRVEQLALACYALALAMLITANVWIAAAASLIIGVGYGIQNPASAQILSKATPPHRRSVIFSIKQAGVPLGGVIASLAYPTIVPIIGWRLALAITAIPCVAMIVVLRLHPDDDYQMAYKQSSLFANFVHEQRLVWGNSQLRVLAVLGMLYSSLQLSISSFTVLMLVDHHWKLVTAAFVAGSMQAFGAAGRISWGFIGDRIGGFQVLALIGAIATLCMVALSRLDAIQPAAQVCILCLFGFCMTGWNGVLLAECTRHCGPENNGRVIGGVLVYTFIGVMIGPSVLAMIYNTLGDYGFAFLSVSWVAGLGTLLAVWAMWRNRLSQSQCRSR
jgi:MFS family permease